MSRLETIQDQQHHLEVERVTMLAEAFDILAAETGTSYGNIPTGTTGEIAYRSLRAEIALVTGVTETTAERHLSHAYTLRHRYLHTRDAFTRGEISYPHTTVIVEAGTIIGTGNDPDTVTRLTGYQEAVLPIAMDMTPNRLQPIARRLAEQYAEQSLDERHCEARQRRHVRVVEQHDGMADLIAHLPAVEAHSIFARLTRISTQVHHTELRNATTRDATTRDATIHRAATVGGGSARTGTAGGAGSGSGVCGQVDDPGSVAGIRPRTRDQIRADVLSRLARTGRLDTAGDREGPAPTSTTGEPHSDTLDRVATGVGQITAHVQVVVPVALLGSEPTQTLTQAGPAGDRSPSSRPPDATSSPPGSGPPAPGSSPPGSGPPASGSRPPNSGPPGSGPPGATSGPPPEHIPPSFDPPALLAGYGPIDSHSATLLAAQARHWEVVYTEHTSGVILSVDRYRPSDAMRRYLEARDQHCRFPGCRVPSSRCDLDHTIDAAHGGPTSTTNLEALCKGHHTLKHNSGWNVKQFSQGILVWTSPTGRTRIETPSSRVMFRPVVPDPATDTDTDDQF